MAQPVHRAVPMTDDPAQLSALESEAAQAEAQLELELAAACGAAEQAERRLQQLQAAAQRAASGDEEVKSVCRQLSQLSPIRFDDEQARSAALEVRRAALTQRKAARDSLRAALEAFGRRTQALELELSHRAESLVRAQRRAEEKQAAARAPAGGKAASAPPRRESPRVSMYTQVDLGSESNFYGGFSTNLSEGGLFIATLSTPPRGTEVELTFTLPGGTPIKARGVVRWTREVNDAMPDVMPGAGVQFVELAPEVAASISAFVMKRDPLFYVE